MEYLGVCPLVRIGTLPPLLPKAGVSQRNQRGGTHSPTFGGRSQFRLHRMAGQYDNPMPLST